jgi:thioredoxin reductase
METNIPGVFVAGTAVAGTQQRFKAYIETSHGHGPRIAAALTGSPPPQTPGPRVLAEG